MTSRHYFLIACASLWVALGAAGRAATVELDPGDDWFAVLSGPSLNPGDEVVLAAGEYADPRRLEISQRGIPGKPIVLRAAEGARVVFERPDARQNTFNLAGCQHFVVRGVEITGGAAGIRISARGEHAAKFVTVEGCHIHHVGGVAVTANHPGEVYEGLVFRRNHIHHTSGHGEAFYLGSNNRAGGATDGYVFDSVIEGNYIHHLVGPGVSQGDGVELKDGCFGNVVRDNVIHDTNYPGIIVYGADGKRPNVIERNAIWNTGDHGIQAAADAVVRNNVIYNTGGDGIHCRNHQSAVVGRLRIVHNTVLSGSSIRIVMPDELSGAVVVANNAWGGRARIPTREGVSERGNVAGIVEVFPRAGSPCIGAGDPRYAAEDDYNGTPRSGAADAGAYRYRAAGNPAPPIRTGFKGSR